MTHTRAWIAVEHGRTGVESGLVAVPNRSSPRVLLTCTKLDRDHWHADYDPTVKPLSGVPAELLARSPRQGGALAVASVPHSIDGPIIASDDASAAEIAAAIDEFEQWAVEQRCAAVAFVGLASTDDTLAGLARRGYRRIELQPWAVMEDVPSSFEQWRARLAASPRRTVRRELDRYAGQLSVYVRGGEALDATARDMLVEHYAQYGHPRDPARVEDLFRRLVAHHRERLRVIIACDRSGACVGFVAAVIGENEAQPRVGAMRKLPGLRFVLSFYELVRLSGRLGVRTIHYGTENYEAKLLRGCVLRQRFAMMKPCDG